MNAFSPDPESTGPRPSDSAYPAELVTRRQWCVWRIEPDKKSGSPLRCPIGPTG